MKLINKFVIILVCFVGAYSAFLLYSDISIVLDKLLNFKMELLPIIFSLIFVCWCLIFLRWHLLLKNVGINIPVKSSFSIFMSGFALSFFPSELGDLVKVQILKNKYDISRAKSSGIIISEWIYTGVGLVSMCIFGGLFFEISLYFGGIFGIILVIMFILANSKKLFVRFLEFASKIKFLTKFTGTVTDSFDTIKKSTSGKAVIISSLLSISFWLIESIVVFFIMLAYGISTIQILDIIPTYCSAIVLGFISFLPLGTGVVEGSFGVFLENYGIELTASFGVVIIIRLFTRWFAILVGLFALKKNGGIGQLQ